MSKKNSSDKEEYIALIVQIIQGILAIPYFFSGLSILAGLAGLWDSIKSSTGQDVESSSNWLLSLGLIGFGIVVSVATTGISSLFNRSQSKESTKKKMMIGGEEISADEPLLKVLSDLKVMKGGNIAIVEGRVQNVCPTPLHNVTVIAEFRTVDGELIKTISVPIEHNPVPAWESSPFRIVDRASDERIEKVTFDFKHS